jgi:bisanhydrobacterioruberin hydratase
MQRPACYYLYLCYLTGLIGFMFPFYPNFPSLTPMNLWMSVVIMLYFHPEWTWKSVAIVFLGFAGGWFAEMLGVNEGFIFGQYQYGSSMGFQVWSTPIVAGVLWLILNYGTTTLMMQAFPKQNWFIKSILGALLMLSLDILIEPVAIHYGFWIWAGGAVPLQNYIGWFGVGFLLQSITHLLHPSFNNRVAIELLLLQFIFFGVLNFYLAW